MSPTQDELDAAKKLLDTEKIDEHGNAIKHDNDTDKDDSDDKDESKKVDEQKKEADAKAEADKNIHKSQEDFKAVNDTLFNNTLGQVMQDGKGEDGYLDKDKAYKALESITMPKIKQRIKENLDQQFGEIITPAEEIDSKIDSKFSDVQDNNDFKNIVGSLDASKETLEVVEAEFKKQRAKPGTTRVEAIKIAMALNGVSAPDEIEQAEERGRKISANRGIADGGSVDDKVDAGTKKYGGFTPPEYLTPE